jgi:hypothetical protein
LNNWYSSPSPNHPITNIGIHPSIQPSMTESDGSNKASSANFMKNHAKSKAKPHVNKPIILSKYK